MIIATKLTGKFDFNLNSKDKSFRDPLVSIDL